MSLNGDNIVDASLLEPMGNELRTSPTLEEEATLLREELEPMDAFQEISGNYQVWGTYK